MTNLISSTALIVAASACLVSSSWSAPLSFDAGFSGGFQNSSAALRANHAAGNPEPEPTRNQPVFEPDLVAFAGDIGLKIGPGFPEIRYAAKDNVPPNAGALQIRLDKGVAFAQGEAWPLIRIGPDDAPQLQISADSGNITVTAVDLAAQNVRLSIPLPPKEDDTTTVLDVTYDAGALRLYLHGKLQGETAWAGAPEWTGLLRVGTDAAGAAKNTVLVSLKISPEPSPVASAGDDGKLPPGQTFAGMPTKWWTEGQPRLALEALSPDYVPSPWQPVVWNRNTAGVWGRDYHFSGDGLMAQVVSAGAPMLREPVRLHGQSAGRPVEFAFGAPELVEQHPARLTFRRTAAADGFQAEARIHVEYDGMVEMEIVFAKIGPENLERLRLEIPFRAEDSEYLHFIGAPLRYESQNLAKNSNTQTLPEPGESLKLGFKTYVWIGSSERGLQWFAASDENWWPLDRTDAIEIARGKDRATTVALNILEKPLPGAPEKFTLRFGFMASPFRPMPEGWRDWTFAAQYGSPDVPNRANKLIYWPDEWRAMMLDPDPNRAPEDKARATADKVRADHKAGRLILPYWTRIHVPLTAKGKVNPDGLRMAELWGTLPDHARGGQFDLRRVSMDTGWKDYLLWCAERWGRRFGHIDGVYIDETQPIPNTRAESGGGYIAPDGARRPTFEYRGSREYFHRLNYLLTKQNGAPPFIILHNSSTYALPYMSAATAFLPGEHLNSDYFKLGNPDILPPEEERAAGYYYCHVLPMERLIAEGYWQPWGVPIVWLPELKNQKDIVDSPVAARDLLSRLQQVDALIWNWMGNKEEVAKMQRFRKEFGIGAADVRFTPYWRNKTVTTSHEKTVVGVYEKPGARLLIVSNLDTKPVKATLDFQGAVPDVVRNAETRKLVPLQDGKIEISIPRNDYLALVTTEPGTDSTKTQNPTTNNK